MVDYVSYNEKKNMEFLLLNNTRNEIDYIIAKLNSKYR